MYDYPDPGTDRDYCDSLSRQRCARCHVDVSTSELVQMPGVGQICEPCDQELFVEAMAAKCPDAAREQD